MFLQLTDSIYNRKNVVRAKVPHFPQHFEARKISRTVSHWGPLKILCPSLHSRPNAPSFSLEFHSLWSRARGLLFPAPALSPVSTSLITKCQKQWRAGMWRTGRASLQSERSSLQFEACVRASAYAHTLTNAHAHTHAQKFFLFKHGSIPTQISV